MLPRESTPSPIMTDVKGKLKEIVTQAMRPKKDIHLVHSLCSFFSFKAERLAMA